MVFFPSNCFFNLISLFLPYLDIKLGKISIVSINLFFLFENDFIFTAKFEVLPEFNLTDLSSMIIEKLDVEIQEKDIDQVIKNIQKQHVKWEKTTGKAKTGNKIIIIVIKNIIDNLRQLS